MLLHERIRVTVLVVVLAVVGVVGQVMGSPVTPHEAAPVQAASIGVAGGVSGDTGEAMTTALWTMQLVGILMFELWAFGRRRSHR